MAEAAPFIKGQVRVSPSGFRVTVVGPWSGEWNGEPIHVVDTEGEDGRTYHFLRDHLLTYSVEEQ